MSENQSTSQMQEDIFNNAFEQWKPGNKDNSIYSFKKLALANQH